VWLGVLSEADAVLMGRRALNFLRRPFRIRKASAARESLAAQARCFEDVSRPRRSDHSASISQKNGGGIRHRRRLPLLADR
jgi:hypothetical protein